MWYQHTRPSLITPVIDPSSGEGGTEAIFYLKTRVKFMKKTVSVPKKTIRIMQCSTIILTLSCLFASLSYASDTFAQEMLERKVSLQLNQVSLREVLSQIEKQTDVTFVYTDESIAAADKISLQVKDRKLGLVLNQLLKPRNLQFYSVDNQIVIRPKAKQPLGSVSGKVTDSQTGEALPGTSVLLKGTSVATTTDANGTYNINVPDENGVLVFSFVGYNAEEVSVGARTTLNVTLMASLQSLNQVVVVGYGSQQRRDITGSVGVVSGEQIRSNPVTGIDQALQGRVAGVQVTQTSGQPGGGVSVRIRGTSSISAGNEPLYVIDGMPFYNWNTTFNQGPAGIFGTGQPSNALSAINPNDIESMTVLKDAAAAAIYGSRAANGVVIITTKRGKQGKGRVEFDAYYGVQQLSKRIDVLSARQQAELVNEARTNGRADLGNPANPTPNFRPVPAFANPATLDAGTDWQSELFQAAPMESYQLSISGADENTQYAVSGSYFNQQGILKVSGYKRYSARVNLEQKVTERLKIGANIVFNNATNTINRAFGNPTQGGLIYGALQQTPALPVYDANGNFTRLDVSGSGRFVGMSHIDNPLSSALEYWHPINTTRVVGTLFGEYKILKNLTLRTSLGIDANYLKNNIFIPIRSNGADTDAAGNPVLVPPTNPNTGNGFAFASQELTWLNENVLTYTTTLADRHKITAVGGFTAQGSGFERMISRVQNFPNNLVITANAGQTDLTNSFREEWKMVSFLGRVNYAFDDKYLLTAGIRTDGSSRFGPGRRFGYFPSVSVGWRVSGEEFMKNIRPISDLKLRASYGTLGNSEINNFVGSFANYPYLGRIIPTNYTFGRTVVNGLSAGSLSNEKLGWETSVQFDLGMDLSLWSGRVNVIADYYNKETVDMLIGDYPIPHTTGFSTTFPNIGRMRNRGLELTLNTVNIDRAFKWKTDFNIAYNRNRVVNLGANVPFILSGNSITRAEEPTGSFFGWQTDGIFQNQQEIAAAAVQNGSRNNTRPGDVRFRDVDNSGTIDAKDRMVLGSPHPDWVFGLTNTFSYRGVDLNVFLNGVQGNEVHNSTREQIEGMGGNINNAVSTLGRWQSEQNPGNGTMPRATAQDPNNNRRFSNRWLEDGSFLRIRNITLGYNLPDALLRPLRIQRLRLYATVQNLYTFTRYTGYDPEFSRNNGIVSPLNFGVDDSNYPVPRTYMMGLNVQF